MMRQLKTLIIAAALTLFPVMTVAPAYAADSTAHTCGNTKTEFIACDSKTGLGTIGDMIKIVLIVLSIVIGAAALGTLAYAAILYSSARDEQNKVSEAKTIMWNVVIGLMLYGFTVVVINWLLPGGTIEAPTPTASTSVSPSPSQSVPVTGQ